MKETVTMTQAEYDALLEATEFDEPWAKCWVISGNGEDEGTDVSSDNYS